MQLKIKFKWLQLGIVAILFVSCIEKKEEKKRYFFSFSLEDDRKISGYVVIDRWVTNDTITMQYRHYDASDYTLLSDTPNQFVITKKLMYWVSQNGLGFVKKQPLFSSFFIEKCDTTFFENQKFINCFKGKKDISINGREYKNLYCFHQIWEYVIERNVYYDESMVPIYEENTYPASRYYQMKRIDSIPFNP